MNKLPKDIVLKLTEELSPQDFISFCTSNTSDNVIRACNNNDLWKKRLLKDFPYVFKFRDETKHSDKEYYIELFTRTSKTAEDITEIVMKEYGDMRRFLPIEFKKFLYDNLYNFCNEIMTYIANQEDYNKEYDSDEDDGDWLPDNINYIYDSDEFYSFRVSYFPGMKDGYNFDSYWNGAIKYPIIDVFAEEMVKFLL